MRVRRLRVPLGLQETYVAPPLRWGDGGYVLDVKGSFRLRAPRMKLFAISYPRRSPGITRFQKQLLASLSKISRSCSSSFFAILDLSSTLPPNHEKMLVVDKGCAPRAIALFPRSLFCVHWRQWLGCISFQCIRPSHRLGSTNAWGM